MASARGRRRAPSIRPVAGHDKRVVSRQATNPVHASMSLRPTLLPALGVFAAAARHQNFARAAEELHLTASAVSHHVRKLESALGVRLFQRHARGVLLTPQGRQLADAANSAMGDIASVADDLQAVPAGLTLRVSTLHSLAYCWLLPRLPRFCRAHPGIRIELETSHTLVRFDEDGPDLAIRHGLGHWPGLNVVPLMEDEMFPVASPALPGVSGLRDVRDIPRLPLIEDMCEQGWRDWFRHAGLRGQRLGAMHSFNDSTEAMRAAVYGLGAVLARKHIALPYLHRHELVRLPGPVMKARFGYYIVHSAHRAPSPAARLFIDWLHRQALDERPPVPAQPAALPGRDAPDAPRRRPRRRSPAAQAV